MFFENLKINLLCLNSCLGFVEIFFLSHCDLSESAYAEERDVAISYFRKHEIATLRPPRADSVRNDFYAGIIIYKC